MMEMEEAIPEEEVKKKPPKKKRKRKKRGNIKSVLDGSVLMSEYVTKQMPFVFFLAFLAMLYIANSYRAKRIEKTIKAKVKQVEELDAEYVSLTSDLIYKSRRSSVERIAKERGLELEDAVNPPIVIEIDE